jgi:Amt family ammonium transporter
MGGVSIWAQVVGSLIGAGYAFLAGGLIYLVLKVTVGIRLTEEEEQIGADLAVHKIGAYPEDDLVRSR